MANLQRAASPAYDGPVCDVVDFLSSELWDAAMATEAYSHERSHVCLALVATFVGFTSIPLPAPCGMGL